MLLDDLVEFGIVNFGIVNFIFSMFFTKSTKSTKKHIIVLMMFDHG